MKFISRLLFSLFFLFKISFPFAQNKITFLVKQPSVLHSDDNLFIACNFNSWDPADKEYELKKTDNGISTLTISLATGNYEYKLTRGSWDKVETAAGGKGISNRVITINRDTTINIEIGGWDDDFKQNISLAKVHTSSANVKIMDTAFLIPQLNCTRRIWIYLPPDYKSTKKRYPVLYMHDGQNLFDEATSYSGEWGVDKYLDLIFSLQKKEVIVVGIDNGLFKRMNEYNPWAFQQFGKGEGDKYVEFLVKTLKSYIDSHYRTLRDKKNTFIAGSSMGGLISLYAVIKYPTIYGGAGIFSPAFWTASGIDSAVISNAKRMHSRLFFYAGGKEGDSMLPDMKRIEKELKVNSSSPIDEIIDADAKHNEAAWRKYFPYFYKWTILKTGK